MSDVDHRLTEAEQETRCRREQISHEHYTREVVEQIKADAYAAGLASRAPAEPDAAQAACAACDGSCGVCPYARADRLAAEPDAATRTVRVEVLRDALAEMRAVIAEGDAAEVAASTPGEAGRSAAVARRDALYNDPADWLNGYIDRAVAGAGTHGEGDG